MQKTRNETLINEVDYPAFAEKYIKVTHKSGLDIYVYPKETSTTHAMFATKYGSIDNGFRLAGDAEVTDVPMGIAHFLEHKLFTNEGDVDSFERFSELGADANAYTSYDKTVYLFSCTSNFKECLGELLSFVTHPYFTEESVEKERGIIAEEIGLYEDSPSSRAYRGMLEGLYHIHDIKNNICGTVESISAITPELLYRCHSVFYDLSNMILVVCGNVRAADVIAVADEELGASDSRDIIRKKTAEPPFVLREKTVQRMQLAKPIFDIGIKDTAIPSAPLERAKRDVAMSIVTDLLFSQTGELYSRLYEGGMISPGLSSSYTLSESFGFCAVSGDADDPEAVYELIKAYTLKKREEGFSPDEFERCRKVFYASFVRGLDSAEDIAGDLVDFVLDGYDYFEYADIVSTITLSEVMEIFRSSFSEECFTLSFVIPLDEN